MPQPEKQDDYNRDQPNLDGYYVVRGFNKGHGFSSILDLPKAEAVAIMEAQGGTRGKGPADANGKRDQNVYYEDRQATDKWVRSQTNVDVDRKNPIFFAITKDPQFFLDMKAQYGELMVVPLKNLDTSKWSFTYDDSMGNYFSRNGNDKNPDTENFLADSHPLHGKVMNVAQVVQAIEKYGFKVEGKPHPREIEAQYWGKEFDPLAKGGYIVHSDSPKTTHEQEMAKAEKKREGAEVKQKSAFMQTPKAKEPAAAAPKKHKAPALK